MNAVYILQSETLSHVQHMSKFAEMARLPTELTPRALSIRPKIPEIPGCGADGTDIFRNFFPKFWVYLARLA